MAKKQKKKRNKKYRQKYTTGGRLDMRNGGRVRLAHGPAPLRADYNTDREYQRAYSQWQDAKNIHEDADKADKGADDPNRQPRVERTGTRAEEIAQGDMVIPAIPERQKIDLTDTVIDPTQQTGQFQDYIQQATPQKTRVVGENVRTEDAKIATQQFGSPTRQAQIERARDVNVETAQKTRQGIGSAPQQTLTDTRDFAQAQIQPGSQADTVEGVLSSGAFTPEVIGQGGQVSETPNAERQTRESIVDSNAVGRNAAQILGTIGYDTVSRRTVTGEAAKGAAASMIAQTAAIPQNIAAAIVEDPATVEAQVDTNPVEVNAAIAALPTEALVSSQMETLLAGMEDGNIPLWAKPAVDAVNQNMAARGMLPSTVGRDALFNAVIQSAFPMAQGNAQALQTRAAQNLSNEQQANLQQATQQQQLRLNNLANRQTAESQTAQNAQQMKTMQSQFTQQAVMTTAEQQQQTTTQN